MADFPLTFNCAPELEARFLLNVIELEAQAFGTHADNRTAQKSIILFQNGVESVFDVVGTVASFHL